MPLLIASPEATDPAYINLQKDIFWLEPPSLAREHVEELYSLTNHILDKKFKTQCKHHFHPCYSEMYFAAVLQDRCGYSLTHPSDKGADFYVSSLDAWVEIVALSDGIEGSPNSIPKPESCKAYRYPEKQVILRMCSAFEDKAEKMLGDIKKGRIEPSQPIILCVSGGGLSEPLPMYPQGSYPQIVKALLPVGDLRLWFCRESRALVSREYQYRDGIKKITKNGDINIVTEAFLNERYSHISAVVYSWANAGNPIPRESWGSDIYTIHNPKAQNPLPQSFLKCGVEYLVTVESDTFTTGREHTLLSFSAIRIRDKNLSRFSLN